VRCNTPEAFEFVKEPLNKVATSVEHGAETDWILAIGPRRDVGPGTFAIDHRADPVGVISLIGKQHLSSVQITQQIAGDGRVMLLTGCDGEPYGQTMLVGHSMDLCSKTSPAASETTIRVAFLKSQPNGERARLCRRPSEHLHRKRLLSRP